MIYQTIGKNIFKKVLTNIFVCDIIRFVNGASPSGKATDSDSVTSGVRIPVPQPEKLYLACKIEFFSYIRLRRVLLLRSDIRLTPSDIRFASLGGEYNITAERSGAISLLRSKNITLTKSAYH